MSNIFQMCLKKIRYASAHAARFRVKRENANNEENLTVYKCPYGSPGHDEHWHVGHTLGKPSTRQKDV